MKIGQFQQIFELNPNQDNLDYKIKAVSILTGKSEEEIENLPIDQFKALANSIKPPNVDNLSSKLLFETKVNGIKFQAILSIKKSVAAEFLEMSTFTKDEKTVIKNLHKLLAIFYKPKSKWFGLKKVEMSRPEVAELFLNHMDINVAYPLAVFFLKMQKNFTPVILTSLERRTKEVLKMMKEVQKK